MDPKGIIEAALFSAGKPLSVGDISTATGLDEADVRKGMRKLLKAFRVRETAIEIVKSGSRYSMQVKEAYSQPTQKAKLARGPPHDKCRLERTMELGTQDGRPPRVSEHPGCRLAPSRRGWGPPRCYSGGNWG